MKTQPYTWKSAYPTTPLSELKESNFDKTTGGWISTGPRPMTRHTYDMMVYAQNVGELILT